MKLKHFILTVVMIVAGPSLAYSSEILFIKNLFKRFSDASLQTQLVYNEIEKLYDFKTLFEISTQDFSDQLTSDQYEDLSELFSQLMLKNIKNKYHKLYGKNFEKKNYQIKEKNKNQTTVAVFGRYEDTNIEMNFTLMPNESSWKIVDLEVKGALLSRQYRGQFNRIFRSEGAEGLEKRMRTKLAQL